MNVDFERSQLRNIESFEYVYKGRILNLRVDQVLFPSGDIKPREVVEHRPAAAVLAIDGEGCVYLIAQYRHAVDEVIYEIPAGIVEDGEDIAQTAVRELQEEIGFKPGRLREFFRLYSSPGFSDEEVVFFIAEDLEPSELPKDDDEQIEAIRFSPDEIVELLEGGRIKDGKTMIALYWYQLQRVRENVRQAD